MGTPAGVCFSQVRNLPLPGYCRWCPLASPRLPQGLLLRLKRLPAEPPRRASCKLSWRGGGPLSFRKQLVGNGRDAFACHLPFSPEVFPGRDRGQQIPHPQTIFLGPSKRCPQVTGHSLVPGAPPFLQESPPPQDRVAPPPPCAHVLRVPEVMSSVTSTMQTCPLTEDFQES